LPFWNKKTDTWLVVGLGNPGEKYAGTRHNIGFMSLDRLAEEHHFAFARSRNKSKTAEGRIEGKHVVLAKPQTFMNLSGEAVGKLVRKYGVKPDRLIVVHDELDLPLGKIRIRQGGSSAGHKGIISIVEHTGTEEFIRLRVGIGRPDAEGKTERDDVIDHVLSDLSPEERATIDRVIQKVGEAVLCILTDGLVAAMNRYNGLDLRKEPTG
jgi:PTH1 family peptidyl-tRNA hydrolase